jgi:hypothetical protein
VLRNKVDKFGAGFFSSGKAAGSADTCSINSQRGMTEKRQADGKFQPAKAGEFSHGAFQPFANGANDRRAAVNSNRLKPGNSRIAPSSRLQMAQTIGAQR